jgi:hypothetical protein
MTEKLNHEMRHSTALKGRYRIEIPVDDGEGTALSV